MLACKSTTSPRPVGRSTVSPIVTRTTFGRSGCSRRPDPVPVVRIVIAGKLAERIGGRDDDRGAGRRDELARRVDPDDRHTDEQGHRGRSRQRHRAVVHLADAATERDRGADHLLDLERVEQRERAADVDEGVVATQLVQDDLARPDAVDGRLGGDQTVERVERPRADAFRQPGSGHQGSHRLGGASPAFHGPDVDVGGREPRAYRPRDLDLRRRRGRARGRTRRGPHVARQRRATPRGACRPRGHPPDRCRRPESRGRAPRRGARSSRRPIRRRGRRRSRPPRARRRTTRASR